MWPWDSDTYTLESRYIFTELAKTTKHTAEKKNNCIGCEQ